MVIQLLKIKNILLMLFCLTAIVFAENKAEEKVLIHLNKDVFTNGSILKYKVYLTSSAENKDLHSNIIYFEILDPWLKPVVKWKSRMQDNSFSGEYQIPETFTNGMYFFRAYTNYLRGYPDSVLQSIPIFIQRVYEDVMDTLYYNKNSLPFHNNLNIRNNDLLQVQIKNESDSIQINVQLSQESEAVSANLSISLTEINPFDSIPFVTNHNPSQINNKVETIPFQKERDVYLLQGRIFSKKDSTTIKNRILLLSYTDNSVHFKYCHTNDCGEFCFALDSAFDNKNLVIQLADPNIRHDDIGWIIYNKSKMHTKVSDSTIYLLNHSEKYYLQQLQKRELVNSIFNPGRYKNTSCINNCQIRDFFYEPTSTVIPADYINLNNFKDICDNILPSVRFKKTGKYITVGLVLDQQQVSYENILICVNGNPCYNLEYIESLSSRDIKRIDIFNSVLMYGNLTLNGIIAIYTNDKTLRSNIFPNPHFITDHTFYNPFKEVQVDNKTNGPALLPDLYWNSNITIHQNESCDFKIKKAEIGEKYYLVIKGIYNKEKTFMYQTLINFETL